MTADSATLFFEICQELNADTEEQRIAILEAMAELGRVKTVVETPKTKEEYIEHLAKHFNVLKIKEKESNG